MTTRLSNAVRSAMADAWADTVDAGSGAGYARIYTGGQPASVATAPTGTLLGQVTYSDPAFGAAVNGVATANPISPDTSGDATGTAGWFRVFDSSGTGLWDGNITVTGGGGDMTLDNVNIVAGGAINITSHTLTQPAG